MAFEPGHEKVGGRTAGTPNKGTKLVKDFFEEVLNLAFSDPAFKPALVKSIVDLTIDPKVLITMLHYVAGAPPKEMKHGLTARLEDLVLGRVPAEGTE